MKSEVERFVAMIERAEIEHVTRSDHDPPGIRVIVDHQDEMDTLTEWHFDSFGRLTAVSVRD